MSIFGCWPQCVAHQRAAPPRSASNMSNGARKTDSFDNASHGACKTRGAPIIGMDVQNQNLSQILDLSDNAPLQGNHRRLPILRNSKLAGRLSLEVDQQRSMIQDATSPKGSPPCQYDLDRPRRYASAGVNLPDPQTDRAKVATPTLAAIPLQETQCQ